MIVTQLMLPFLTAFAGGLFGALVQPTNGLEWGAGIGFGAGCAMIIVSWLLIAVLKRL
jgi:uncharacterized membrane protein (DUF485 family)